MSRFLLLIIPCLFLYSCNDPETVDPISKEGGNSTKLTRSQVFVLNEGNFGNGVATLSRIESTDTSFRVENNAFRNRNNEFMGNIAQSMTRVGEEYWITINNSQKIIRCDLDLNKTGEITGFVSPRYLAVSSSKVYVSDLFADSLYVVDKASRQIVKRIFTGTWNEEVIIVENELWVTNANKNTISVYSTTDETLVKEIEVVTQPLAITTDAAQNVWVLCNGGLLTRQDDPYLFKIDRSSYMKIDSVNLSLVEGLPSRLSVFENEVYLLAKHIYHYENGNLDKVVDAAGLNLYGFHVSSKYIYYTDAKDFVRQGDLYRYEKTFDKSPDRLQVGIIPGFIYEK